MEDYSFDLQRIFFGDLPALFLLEILFRIAFLYVYTLANLRLLGKRSASELTPLDLLIVVGLGSAVGDPMFYPKVGLLHGMVTISTVVLIQRAVVYFANRHEKLEGVIKGTATRVIVDGMLDRDGMREAELSREEVFMMLREQSFDHLGQVQRVYVEPDGKASIYPYDEAELPRAGLSVLPPWDIAEPAQHDAGERVPQGDDYACTLCGYVATFEAGETFPVCPRCDGAEWTHAVSEPSRNEAGN